MCPTPPQCPSPPTALTNWTNHISSGGDCEGRWTTQCCCHSNHKGTHSSHAHWLSKPAVNWCIHTPHWTVKHTILHVTLYHAAQYTINTVHYFALTYSTMKSLHTVLLAKFNNSIIASWHVGSSWMWPNLCEWAELPHPATQGTGPRCHLEHVHAIKHTATPACTTLLSYWTNHSAHH